jgi:eukaryotic-like serine/threonine-protein kinase
LKKIPAFLRIFTVVLAIIVLTSTYGCRAGDISRPGETPAPVSPPSLDWPMFRGNLPRTGAAASTITLPLTQKWTFQGDNVIMSSPAIAGGRVFISSYALDAASGNKLWEFPTDGAVTNSPAVSGGRVFLGSYEMKIYARDAATGKKVWEFQTDN